MTINTVNGIGWEGWLPQNPRTNTMLTPDSLSEITAAGYLTLEDPAVFPQLIYNTDLWDIEYDYDPETGTQTYARFVTSIDSEGVITLSPSFSGGNATLPVTDNDLASFDGTTGKIKDSGVSLLAGSFTKVPRIASGSYGAYTVGNFLIAADASGNIIGAAGNVPTQTNTSSATSPSIKGAQIGVILTATSITAGVSRGFEAFATMVGASGGQVYALESLLTASGTIDSAAIVSANYSQMFLESTVINSAQVSAGLDAFGSAIDTPSGTLTNCSVRRLENLTSSTIGQMLDIYGHATYLFRLDTNGTPGYLFTPTGGTPSGTLRNITIFVEGVGPMKLLAATVWS